MTIAVELVNHVIQITEAAVGTLQTYSMDRPVFPFVLCRNMNLKLSLRYFFVNGGCVNLFYYLFMEEKLTYLMLRLQRKRKKRQCSPFPKLH